MIKEKELKINGKKVHLKHVGDGQCQRKMLLLHGWNNSKGSSSWTQFLEDYHALDPNTMIVAPDMPGFGQSEEPDSVWGVHDYTNWVESLYRELEMDSDTVLAGHSFGGAVASLLSKKVESKKLILMAAAIIRPTQSTKQKIIKSVAKLAGPLKQTPLKKVTYKLIGNKEYDETSGTMKNIFQKVIREDILSEAANIQANAIVIWGTRDTYTPIAQGRKINETIPNSKMLTYDEVNHGLMLHASDRLSRDIFSFVKS